jgi:hypothetical protein
LDFALIAPTSGSIKFAGGTAPLIGANIDVDSIVGLGTPLHSGATGQRNCIGCVLSFTTGPATAGTWNFGPGGTIRLVGGVDLNNNAILDGSDIAAGTTLLSGSFSGTAVVLAFGGGFRIVGAGFIDYKNSALAAFYGLPGGATIPYAGGLNISFLATGNAPNAFSSSRLLSGDIVNEHQADLPSSLLLLGSGLVGFAYLTARARQRGPSGAAGSGTRSSC